jgi:hypothetical protein
MQCAGVPHTEVPEPLLATIWGAPVEMLLCRPMSAQANEEYCILHDTLPNNPISGEKDVLSVGHDNGQLKLPKILVAAALHATAADVPRRGGDGPSDRMWSRVVVSRGW